MKRKFGAIFMAVGAVLIIAALSLFAYNEKEQMAAQKATAEQMQPLIQQIRQRQEQAQNGQESDRQDSSETTDVTAPPSATLPLESVEMNEVEVDGYTYIGYISIPALELELPILSDWDYDLLKVAPCRYVGTVKGGDLVLMAHNYRTQFGKIRELSIGDEVIFVDVDGISYRYEVMAKDVLMPTAVDEMTSGAFDLTLFTCTYGGASRVTVYCDRVN